MNVVVVGNGAREHVIAETLGKTKQEIKLHAYMSSLNPGIEQVCSEVQLAGICNPGEVAKYCRNQNIDLVVIGPEAPLCAGVADAVEDEGILCVGPRKEPARIETDKTFVRNLMNDYKIPGNPAYQVFTDKDECRKYFEDLDTDVVVKPAGLTGGKGVKIMGEHFDQEGALEYALQVIEDNIGGKGEVVVEEKLVGEEFTLQAFVDGNKVAGMPMVQDHKRAYEGDIGPNTGGMGSYNDAGFILPFATQKDYDAGLKIMEETVKAIKKETSQPYKGFLYGQFMATADDVKVIEFNARMGDPEAMNVLPLLDHDFLDVCQQMAGGMLKGNMSYMKQATVCKYLVPKGYPEKPEKDNPVEIKEKKIKELGANLYYASVRREDSQILTGTSRAIAVVGTANTITEAEVVAEHALENIEGNLFHRKDIGTREVVQKRIDHMRELRGETG